MTGSEIRKKFIEYFKASPRNHKEISPAPLVLENDSSTLFTSAGMQPLVPYLLGEPHPLGKRLVNSQPSIRLQDIEEVGDNRHTTFFEMLGNWSLGDYFKEEQLGWILEFFVSELGLSKDKLWISVFEGTPDVPRDEESAGIWKKLGIPDEKIIYYSAAKNWWSMTGTPEEMQVGHIGGPDSEVFFEFSQVEHSPEFGKKCHPNCQCGRFLEIGNSVFIQYKKVGENKLDELSQKNVDFGGGIERLAAAVKDDPDIFKTDLFFPTVEVLANITKTTDTYDDNPKPYRIIADHLRAAAFLVGGGAEPSNKLQGYVLRRLIRRAMIQARKLGMGDEWLSNSLPSLLVPYKSTYPSIVDDHTRINDVITTEVDRFRETINLGLSEAKKIDKIDGRKAFDLYQNYGFPFELTEEIFTERGQKIDREQFKMEFEKHKEKSRTTSAGAFKGGLADHSSEVIRLHTATHLLLASLRKVLGEHVVQRGQNITKERSRFDFPHHQKLTEEELKKVEDTINEEAAKDLPVSFKVMPKGEAEKTGAIHAFNEKYADTVKVYTIGPSTHDVRSGSPFSREFCGGPHVTHTGEIGRVKIKKQEKIGSGVIRIYTTVQNG